MAINLETKNQDMDPIAFNWNYKDVILYNIGVGATELDFTYENQLKVLPTFAIVPAFPALGNSVPVIGANLFTLLHGEQSIEILNPNIPVEAKTVTESKIGDIWDKGKGAVYTVEATTKTEEGEALFKNTFTIFLRGEGGFGGDRGPEPGNEAPEREPDAIVEDTTSPTQNLIYRLSGDLNPLHIDPEFAKMGGFDKPILHGLCTYGYVGRAVLSAFMDNNPENMKSYTARFRNVVFPGQKIITKMWKDGKKIIISADTEDGRNVISNAAAEMR